MPKNYCIMQIWAESGKSALPICNYSQILYQFLTFTQNLKRSLSVKSDSCYVLFAAYITLITYDLLLTVSMRFCILPAMLLRIEMLESSFSIVSAACADNSSDTADMVWMDSTIA